jgi:hypothetical protein
MPPNGPVLRRTGRPGKGGGDLRNRRDRQQSAVLHLIQPAAGIGPRCGPRHVAPIDKDGGRAVAASMSRDREIANQVFGPARSQLRPREALSEMGARRLRVRTAPIVDELNDGHGGGLRFRRGRETGGGRGGSARLACSRLLAHQVRRYTLDTRRSPSRIGPSGWKTSVVGGQRPSDSTLRCRPPRARPLNHNSPRRATLRGLRARGGES